MKNLLIICICTVTLFPACTSTHTLKPSQYSLVHQLEIQPGDEIKVHKHDDTSVTIIVRRVTETAVLGGSQRIPFTDIKMLEKAQTKESMTTASTVLIILLIVVGGLASAYAGHLVTAQLFGL